LPLLLVLSPYFHFSLVSLSAASTFSNCHATSKCLCIKNFILLLFIDIFVLSICRNAGRLCATVVGLTIFVFPLPKFVTESGAISKNQYLLEYYSGAGGNTLD